MDRYEQTEKFMFNEQNEINSYEQTKRDIDKDQNEIDIQRDRYE